MPQNQINLLNPRVKTNLFPFQARIFAFSSAVVAATLFIVWAASGANTTIGNNITTSGNLTVSGTTALASLTLSGGLNASSTFQASGAATFYSSVGVGTTSPSELLSIHGNASISGTTTLANLTATGTVLLATAGGNVSIGTPGSKVFVAGGVSVGSSYAGVTAPPDGMIISGNVGIATTSPSQLLSVQGNALISGTTTAGVLYATSSIKVGTTSPIVGLGSNLSVNSSGYLQATAGASTFLSLTDTQSSFTANRIIHTNAGGTALTDTAGFVFDGINLGIGTTTPRQLLSVQGNALFSGDITSVANIKATGTATSTYSFIGGSNPASVGSANTGTSPSSVYVSGRYAYVVNNTSNTLQVFDVSTSSPALVGSAGTGSDPRSVYVSGHYAYVANRTSNTLQVFDVSTSSPALVGSAGTGSDPRSVYVSGHYAYVANYNNETLQVFDVSNPSAPTSVGSANTGIGPSSVYVSGRYAYVANDNTSNTLQVFDVSNPSAPTSVGSANTGIGPSSVYVSGRYAYVVNTGNETLQVFDVSTSSPALVGSAGTGSDPKSVYVSGRYAYVVGSSNTLQVFDVSNPSAPTSVGSAGTDTGPWSVYVSGRYAYVANYNAQTLQVFDVSGLESSSAIIHSLEAGNLQVRNDVILQGQLQVYGGINVGDGGIFSNGPLSVYIASTTQTNPISAYFQGNVGIGTTSPSQLLSVHGNALFSGNITSVANIMATGTLSLAGTTGTSTIASGQGFTIGDSKLVIIGSNGKVGIGTASPGLKLNVIGTNGDPASSGTAQNGAMRLEGLDNQVVLDFGSRDTSPWGSWLQVTDRTNLGLNYNLLLNPNGGKVGIGTANPQQILHAVGNQILTGDLDIYGADINLGTGSATTTLTSASGNLGIATTSPSQLLSVHGNALFSGNITSVANITATGSITFTNFSTTTISGGKINAFSIATSSSITNPTLSIDTSQGKSGYVGIGTLLPKTALDVSGWGRFTAKTASSSQLTASSSILTLQSDGVGLTSFLTLQGHLPGANNLMIQSGRNELSTIFIPKSSLEIRNKSGVTWTAKSAWNAPDVGGLVKPAFADLDSDGDYDLMLGESGGISYAYENIGSISNPIWAAKPEWNAPNVGQNAKPVFADLDNDGDYDLMIGEANNTIIYGYENTGSASNPVWTAKSSWNSPGSAEYQANPALADLDNDGDYDLIVGTSGAGYYAYENTGSVSNPVWTAKSSWNVAGNAFAAPSFADLDNDGDYDLMIGTTGGEGSALENIGSASNPVWTDKSAWNAPDVGSYSNPAFADLDNDGDYDLMVCEEYGVCFAYENTGSNSSVYFGSSGKLGIGTTTPLGVLSVQIPAGAAYNSFVLASTTPSGGTETHLVVTAAGNVGIGTTSPASKLSIEGTCVDTGAGCAGDYAELYPASEPVQQGEITAFDPDNPKQIRKARSGDRLFGVVSTNPAIVIEGSSLQFLAQPQHQHNPTKPAIALAGRVPVKVNLEGGDIQIGDPITISSEPGVGKKAAESGMIIGYALESLLTNDSRLTTNDQLKILVFVSLGYWMGPDLLNRELGIMNQESGEDSSLLSSIIDTVKNWLESLQVFIEDGLVRLKELIAEKITVKQLCVEDVCVDKAQLKALLENAGFAPPVQEPEPEPESDSGTTQQ